MPYIALAAVRLSRPSNPKDMFTVHQTRKLRATLMSASALTASIFVMAAASEAAAQNVGIGDSAGSNETLDVGAGQTLSGGQAIVGFWGTGTLNVTDGGRVDTNGVGFGLFAAGLEPGALGTINVSGAQSSIIARAFLAIGFGSSGVLSVSDGATARGQEVSIGLNAGSNGTATVTGAGSTLASVGYLSVGLLGNGQLIVSDGAGASSQLGFTIGDRFNGSGQATVTGAGSSLTSSGEAWVGYEGNGELTVSDGGRVSASADMMLGDMARSVGVVTVTGASSTLATGGNLFVGNAGTGTLTVSAGGDTSAARDVWIGNQTGSTGTATVTGVGSTLTAGNLLSVGTAGAGTLTVSAGGSASGQNVVVGHRVGSSGSVIVTGAGSSLTAVGNLELGGYAGDGGGVGGDLTVSNSGAVTANVVIVGNAGVGTAVVDGAGSSLTAINALVVGGTTTWGTLTVSGGGRVTTREMIIGELAGGPGSVTITGAGSTLNATGGITLGQHAGSQGTLTVGAASGASATAAGIVNGNITFGPGSGQLVFNHNTANYAYTGTITDAANGRILFEAGQTTFNTIGTGFTGVSDVRSGAILNLNGSVRGTMNVLAGGELRGAGTIGVLNNAGTLRIGGDNVLGTLNGTSAAFVSGSIFAVDFSGASSDSLVLTGAASIASGSILSVNRPTGGVWKAGDRATFLTAAGGLTGRFTLQNAAPLSAFLSLRDGYTATSAYLEIAQTRDFAAAGLTANQRSAAAGAQSLGSGSALFTSIANIANDAAAQVAFDALSGELHPGVRGVLARDGYRLQQAVIRNGATGEDDAGTRVWGELWTSDGKTDGDGNAERLDHDSVGFIAGADMRVADGWRLGAALGFDEGDVDSGRGAGHADTTRRSVLAYVDGQVNGWNLRGGLGYTDAGVKTRRVAAFASPTGNFNETLAADYDGSVTHAYVDVSYPFAVGDAQLAPFANLSRVSADTDGFAETGGLAALKVAKTSADLTFSTLGVRASEISVAGATLSGSAGWRHASGDRDALGLHALTGGSNFRVQGVEITDSAAVVDLHAEWRPLSNLTVGAGVSYVGASGESDRAARVSLRYSF